MSPGNSLTISHPNSSALAISVSVPHPGDHKTFLLLQTIAMSSLKTGVTIKFAPKDLNHRHSSSVNSAISKPLK